MNAQNAIPLIAAPAVGLLDGVMTHEDEKRNAASSPTPTGLSSKRYQTAYRTAVLGAGIAMSIIGAPVAGLTLIDCGIAMLTAEVSRGVAE